MINNLVDCLIFANVSLMFFILGWIAGSFE